MRGLSNAKSSTGLSLRKADCGRSKVNVSVPLSSSSAKCTDGENNTNLKIKKKKSNKYVCNQRSPLPPTGCKTSGLFLFVSLESSNKTELDESETVQSPKLAKLLFVSSPSFPTASRSATNISSTKHGALCGTSPVCVELVVWWSPLTKYRKKGINCTKKKDKS